MKPRWISFLAASGVLLVFLSAQGGDALSAAPFIALSNVPVPEMPAKAADLVQAAPAADREETAQKALRAIAMMARAGVMPYVVSAICGRNPEVAGAVVTTAIELHPEDAVILAKAAVCAAPGQVEEIVFAAGKASPGACAKVALVASRRLPSATEQILAGFLKARPDLKPYLEEAEAEVGTNRVEAVIKQTVQLLTDDAKVWSK
jgi:hypothetical protein